MINLGSLGGDAQATDVDNGKVVGWFLGRTLNGPFWIARSAVLVFDPLD